MPRSVHPILVLIILAKLFDSLTEFSVPVVSFSLDAIFDSAQNVCHVVEVSRVRGPIVNIYSPPNLIKTNVPDILRALVPFRTIRVQTVFGQFLIPG